LPNDDKDLARFFTKTLTVLENRQIFKQTTASVIREFTDQRYLLNCRKSSTGKKWPNHDDNEIAPINTTVWYSVNSTDMWFLACEAFVTLLPWRSSICLSVYLSVRPSGTGVQSYGAFQCRFKFMVE